jgi:hypothetical protein
VADVLGLAAPTPYGPFLASEGEFDEILARDRISKLVKTR